MSQRTRRSTTEWQSLIEQQAASGLSARKFCDGQQIGYASFCKWRRQLGNRSVDPVVDISQLFASDSDQSGSGWHIELDLGHGVKLNLKPA